GAMEAPRMLAPMSVGAPMRRTRTGGVGGTALMRSPAAGAFAALRLPQAVDLLQRLPGFVGGFNEAEQVEVFGADHAGVDQVVEVDQLGPELAPEQQHRALAALAGLDQG